MCTPIQPKFIFGKGDIFVVRDRSKIRQELEDNLRNRKIDHKHLYMEGGADLFYAREDSAHSYAVELNDAKKLSSFLLPYLQDASEKVQVISIGCGNARKDKHIIREVERRGHEVSYVGIDTSYTMLLRAQAQLEECLVGRKNYVAADFLSDDLRFLVQDDEKITRVFMLLGGTMGNCDPSVSLPCLQALMKPGDLLWFDYGSTNGLVSKNEKANTVQKVYSTYPKNVYFKTHLSSIVQKLGLDTDKGALQCSFAEDIEQGAYRATFHFEQDNKDTSKRLELLNIRIYEPHTFQKYCERQSFSLRATLSTSNDTQDLYQKK